jgi:hypothetical protein
MSGESTRTVPMSGQFAGGAGGAAAGAGFPDEDLDIGVGGGGLPMDEEGSDDEGI